MASIALIGPDGAGKTTLTRMLGNSGLRRFKDTSTWGIEMEASNVALPTSRLAEAIKRRRTKKAAEGAGRPAGGGVRVASKRSPAQAVWATLRLVNRLADEWYRQVVSWIYQARGFTVLYDRHFAFDFSREVAGNGPEPLDRRAHLWCAGHLYPRPDLVIFLDAPGETLFARKGELTVEELERRRQAFLAVGRRMPMFVRVDATRPLAEVYSEVVRHVMSLTGRKRHQAPAEAVR